jgi:hypothetical protein
MPNESSDKLIHHSIVSFDLPFGIDLPNDNYSLLLDGCPAVVSLRKIKRVGNIAGMPQAVEFAPMSLENDRWGRLFYTTAHVILEHATPMKWDVLLDYKFLDKAIQCIKRIISVYRYVTGIVNMQSLSRADIFSHVVKHYDAQGNELPGSVFAIGGTPMHFGGGHEPVISNEHLLEINKMLSNNQKISTVAELLADARDNHFYENFRIAVAEAESAFEVFIDRYLADKYRSKGTSEQEINSILENTGLKNLLKDHIKKFVSFDYSTSNEFADWERKSYLIRNKVVHDGYTPTLQESYDAIETVYKTIVYINSLK